MTLGNDRKAHGVSLHLFDTATQGLRKFEPLRHGHVSVYVCGATVQAPPHIGHMRSAVAFDILRRWLLANGLEVTFVRNVTDIDDKVLSRAAATGRSWWAIAAEVEREFQDAYRAMNCLPPTVEPRATGHIPDMVALTERLIDTGAAYPEAGSVYFSIARAPEYGSLSGQDPDQLQNADAATINNGYSRRRPSDVLDPAHPPPRGITKRDPRDFALWKAAKPDEPRTAAWETPWGRARPGWHLECSAMATRYLGPRFDIHGGGRDLVFPHHENERAQSRAAGDDFARYWVHNAWVTVGGEKMSKSLNNSLLVRELLAKWPPRQFRYWLASGHYRSTLEYSDAAIRDAAAALTRVDTFIAAARDRHAHTHSTRSPTPARSIRTWLEAPASDWDPGTSSRTDWTRRFTQALDDDLNVSEALAAIHEAVRAGNVALAHDDRDQVSAALQTVTWMADILGLTVAGPEGDGPVSDSGQEDHLVALLTAERDLARRRHEYEHADHIRHALADLGIDLTDTPSGTTWHRR